MQLSRVAIAAVFLVIGALILVPMVMHPSSSSSLASATPSLSASPSASATKPRKPTRTPTHRASQSPSHSASTPTVPAAAPLKVSIGAVRCPGRTVLVSVANTGRQTEDYAITTDGSISVADRIPAGTTRRSTLNVKEDHTTTISVTLHNVPVQTLDRHANCVRTSPGPARTLPHTGPDSGLIFARVATGLAALLTGIVIFWYGRQWPRRRDKMFDE
jgi:hypothetical protein